MRWEQVAEESWEAAFHLYDLSLFRSFASQSNYAAFSYCANYLTERKVTFSEGREAPSHAQLPKLLFDTLDANLATKYEARRAMSRLYKARIDADYHTISQDAFVSLQLKRDLAFIRKLCI